MTSKSIESRLREHNGGSNHWTKANGPFRLIYHEEYETKSEAAAREKFLKSGVGRKLRDTLAGD